jgi:4-amino-4-deoxy-L-arabinose transferase-like glycosyltransferase
MTASSPSQTRWPSAGAVLDGLVVVLGAWFLLAYAVIALVRMRYPFELEWMEGAVLDQVRQVAAGHQLYVAPSIDFIPFQYPPLYFYAGALLMRIIGGGFLPLRLLSFVASLGCFALLFAMVRRESGSAKGGLLAAALFAACFRADGAWYDLARIDSLCLLLVLIATYLARFHATRRGAVAAGGVMALAFLTKQSALLIALPVLAYLIAESWREGLAAAAAFAAVAGGATVILNQVHHGWYVYYVFRMPARMQRIDSVSVDFWRHDILTPLAIAAAMSLGLLAAEITRARGIRAWFYPALALGMIGSAWLSMLHAGAYDNNLIPAYAVLSLLFGLAVAGLEGRGYAGALCAVQLALLLYDPLQQLPTRRSRDAGRALVALIAATPGDVLLPQHGYLSALAGKRTFAHSMAVYDVMRAGDPRDGARLASEFHQAIAGRAFGAVIADRLDPWMRDDLEREYRRTATAIPDADAFWPLTGLRIRPEWIYVPR